jgi:hypothetical protein
MTALEKKIERLLLAAYRSLAQQGANGSKGREQGILNQTSEHRLIAVNRSFTQPNNQL